MGPLFFPPKEHVIVFPPKNGLDTFSAIARRLLSLGSDKGWNGG